MVSTNLSSLLAPRFMPDPFSSLLESPLLWLSCLSYSCVVTSIFLSSKLLCSDCVISYPFSSSSFLSWDALEKPSGIIPMSLSVVLCVVTASLLFPPTWVPPTFLPSLLPYLILDTFTSLPASPPMWIRYLDSSSVVTSLSTYSRWFFGVCVIGPPLSLSLSLSVLASSISTVLAELVPLCLYDPFTMVFTIIVVTTSFLFLPYAWVIPTCPPSFIVALISITSVSVGDIPPSSLVLSDIVTSEAGIPPCFYPVVSDPPPPPQGRGGPECC